MERYPQQHMKKECPMLSNIGKLILLFSLSLSLSSQAQTNTAQRLEIVCKISPSLKAFMLEKLNEKASWTYVSIPEGTSKEQSINAIRHFIENDFEDFVTRCAKVLPYLTDEDSESISSGNPTKIGIEFIALVTYLEQHGFFGVKDFKKTPNFWCGSIAKQRAYDAQGELSDSKVPAISVMFDVCRAIQQTQGHYDDYITLLTNSVCRVFATSVTSTPSIYISSDKESEMPGFTIPNNFWLAELPALIALHHRGIIKDIVINLYDHVLKAWKAGVSLFSGEAAQIPVYRRALHALDDASVAPRFKKQKMSAGEIEAWKKSAPRPHISYGKLARIARRLARNRQLQRAQEEPNGEVLRAGLRRDIRSASPGLSEEQIETKIDEILAEGNENTARNLISTSLHSH